VKLTRTESDMFNDGQGFR